MNSHLIARAVLAIKKINPDTVAPVVSIGIAYVFTN